MRYTNKWLDCSLSSFKGSSKQTESFKNNIFRFKVLVLTSNVYFTEPKRSKNIRVKLFIFLN